MSQTCLHREHPIARLVWSPAVVLPIVIVPLAFPTFWRWLPSAEEFWAGLTPEPKYQLPQEGLYDTTLIEPRALTQWAADYWWVAKLLSLGYVISIWFIKNWMSTREPIYASVPVTAWNLLLSVFSAFGLWATAPRLIESLMTHGAEASFCATPWSYGYGNSGFWTAAFIFSKPFEMIDTVFLLLRKRPVIFLHWYHHATVMLFCWHAYASRIGGAGLWFASMNYMVHSLMYAYFASQTQRLFPRFRRIVKIWFSPVLTFLQITQMVVGLVVLCLGSSVSITSGEDACYLPKVSAILGVVMYSSYFVLFAKLFVEYYILGNRTLE